MSLRHALYLWWGLWFGVTLIHIFFLLFIAVCVLWRQALKQSLTSKIVKDQHLWKEGEEWYWVEGDSELQCRSYKTSSTQRGTWRQYCLLHGGCSLVDVNMWYKDLHTLCPLPYGHLRAATQDLFVFNLQIFLCPDSWPPRQTTHITHEL